MRIVKSRYHPPMRAVRRDPPSRFELLLAQIDNENSSCRRILLISFRSNCETKRTATGNSHVFWPPNTSSRQYCQWTQVDKFRIPSAAAHLIEQRLQSARAAKPNRNRLISMTRLACHIEGISQ